MIYVAIAMALVVGFCLGLLTRAALGSIRVKLWLGETPSENLRNALQLLRSVAFARGELGDNATNMVTAATKRIEAAIRQLEREAA